MGGIRRDVALVVVEMLRSGDYPQGKGCMSRGLGEARCYSAEVLIAEAAIKQNVIGVATYDRERDMWLYGMWAEAFWLPDEVHEWAECSRVGPELIVPGVTATAMPLMWVSDMGAPFNVLADVLADTVSG